MRSGSLLFKNSYLNTDLKQCVKKYAYYIDAFQSINIGLRKGTYLVSVIGTNSERYITYLVEGYGPSTVRCRITTLSDVIDAIKALYPYTINNDVFGISIENTTDVGAVVSVVALYGEASLLS